MARLTLQLPDSLHERLAAQARRDGVSLGQYIVDLMAATVSAADLESELRVEELAGGPPAHESEVTVQGPPSSRD